MGTDYATIASDIDAAQAAAPNNAAWAAMKAEKNALVVEFSTAYVRADGMNTAIKDL